MGLLALLASTLASRWGNAAGFSALALSAVLVLWAWVWLPRLAHRAFTRGEYERAARWYRVLKGLRRDREERTAVEVSLAACALAGGDPQRALGYMASIQPSMLTEPARASWLNNRAYALARAGRDLDDALALVSQAIVLRPDQVGFRHTRGVVLIGLGRLDEAIRELDSLWGSLCDDEAPPWLEAERCYDLGCAWVRKGERDYATDYFERARKAAPGSRWAEQAGQHLSGPRLRESTLSELL